MRRLDYIIDIENDGRVIQEFLHQQGVSHSLLTKLKQTENGITKNGEFAKGIDTVSKGDTLSILITDSGNSPQKLLNSGVEVVYNDDDVLVLNKPPFMATHESRNHRGNTLANVAACYLDDGASFRAVYRLDRDTSGLVLIAKHELAASKLAGKVKKDYYAICDKEITGGGSITLPIARESKSVIKRVVDGKGQRAVTHWKAIKSFNGKTLVKCNLETGKTHQIRVHFAYIYAPLVGDTLYGKPSSLINRQALHCKTIYFTHPVTNEEMTIDSDFPQDFKRVMEE